MRKIIVIMLFVLFSTTSFSQNIKLLGSLIDSENDQPIPYANISVFNMPIGTCTNSNGDFVINFPDSLTYLSLEISCIGFKSKSLPIDSLIDIDTLIINLQPHTYNISDVVVVPGQNDAKAIFKEAISRIDNNYTRKKYYLDAFFRHRVYNIKNSDKTSRLTEAAIYIHKNHYSGDKNKIQLHKIRNSNNYVVLSNSIGRKLLTKSLGGYVNPIHRTLSSERFVQKKWMKSLLKNKHYNLSLKEISYYDNSLVYVLEFKQISWSFLLKKYQTTHTYAKYHYYINIEDFSILKAELIHISHNPESQPYVTNDSIGGERVVLYSNFNKKYYLKYAYYSGKIRDRIDMYNDSTFYKGEVEILVNHIAIRRRDYDRIKYRNRMRKNKTLWDMEYEYDPEFWNSYNVLLDKPLNPTYIKDLEIEEPLEKQFKNKNGDVENRN